MPFSLKLRLPYEVRYIKVVDKHMNVGITARVFFEDHELADLAYSFLLQALEKCRDLASHGITPQRKFFIVVQRVEITPSGREVGTADCQMMELAIRPERERAHPGTWSPRDFILCSRRPKATAIFETWAAAAAPSVYVEPQRGVDSLSVYLGYRRASNGAVLPPRDLNADGAIALPSSVEVPAGDGLPSKAEEILPGLILEDGSNGPHLVRKGSKEPDA